MKTVVKEMDYQKVMNIVSAKKKVSKPWRPNLFWRTLIKLLSKPDFKATNFSWTSEGMEQLDKKQPCLILMNHSCFMDLEIAESIMYPHRPFTIVCTSDGFVGKNFLMKSLGCIPTNKFVNDLVMVKNIKYSLDKLKTSVLMYPEASYSFDGRATPLPESLGKCLKLLNVPVVMIKTQGAFMRNPLYNNLKVRKVNVSATVKYLLSPQKIQELTVEELNSILKNEFTFDGWQWQKDNKVSITENFRAEALNRVLYKCPVCKKENCMEGKGTSLSCKNCTTSWELDQYGYLVPSTPLASLPQGYDFSHVPSWFDWERDEVKKELKNGTYRIESQVDICMLVDTKAIYRVGSGKLIHTPMGFELTGCDGRLNYTQKPKASYSLYSDYNWYEIGDMVCIGNMKMLFYCFPKNGEDIAAKCRLATEELYKMQSL